MNHEKLKKANDLSEKIEKVEEERDKWNTSSGPNYLGIMTCRRANNLREQAESVNLDYVDFEVLKTLALSKINKRLAELQSEFDNL